MYSVIKKKTFKISNHEMRNIIKKYAKILPKRQNRTITVNIIHSGL